MAFTIALVVCFLAWFMVCAERSALQQKTISSDLTAGHQVGEDEPDPDTFDCEPEWFTDAEDNANLRIYITRFLGRLKGWPGIGGQLVWHENRRMYVWTIQEEGHLTPEQRQLDIDLEYFKTFIKVVKAWPGLDAIASEGSVSSGKDFEVKVQNVQMQDQKVIQEIQIFSKGFFLIVKAFWCMLGKSWEDKEFKVVDDGTNSVLRVWFNTNIQKNILLPQDLPILRRVYQKVREDGDRKWAMEQELLKLEEDEKRRLLIERDFDHMWAEFDSIEKKGIRTIYGIRI